MNKNLRSRIPVPVTKKSSNLSNDGKNLFVEKVTSSLKTSDANKISKMHLTQKKIEKTCSQPVNSRNLKDTNVRNLNFKNKQASLRNGARYDNINRNNVILERDLKLNDKNKHITCKNLKSNLGNKEVRKEVGFKKNISNRKLLPFKTKTKSSCIDETNKSKKENLPSPKSHPFETEKHASKENHLASKQDCFSAQENVEFEANEFYRKMILTNRELSPSICKLMPSLRLSSLQCERPSVYQKLEIPDDPLKEALKALENTCLSVKRVRKENKLPSSPYRDRDSIYTPCADPNKDFLKRLEEFKLKKSQKTVSRSTKKVTFNLDTSGCTPKNSCDIQHNPLKHSENTLIQINEKSEENTPSSPQSEKKCENKSSDFSSKDPEYSNLSNRIIGADNKDNLNKIEDKDDSYLKYKESKTANQSDTASQNNHETIRTLVPDVSFHQNGQLTCLQNTKAISCQNFPDFAYCSQKVEKYENCQEINNVRLLEQKKMKESAKIYTPKPISLASKSKLDQSYSPEILADRKSKIVTDLAPIYTPLVLKSQAKNIMFSPEADEGPIPLKLNFAEEEKDTPKKETCKNHTQFTFDKIVTIQKKMDDLADKECHLSLLHENFPVICGRYLTNPIAMILNEGDDMHFIPIQL